MTGGYGGGDIIFDCEIEAGENENRRHRRS